MNRLFIFVVSGFISVSSYAGCDDVSGSSHPKMPGEITLNFHDARVSEVVNFINLECQEYQKPIEASNPDSLITINFAAIRCEGAAAIIEDYALSEEQT